jgi:putative NADH-flavin reductase
MRVAVLGGSGMIGAQIVAEASSRGHQVTAISRSGDDPHLDGVSVHHADATDPAVTNNLADDHDAIVAATVPGREPGADHQPYLDMIASLVKSAGTATLFVVGGAGSLLMPDGSRLSQRPEAPVKFKKEAATVAAGLYYLQEHGCDIRWTYLSPPSMIRPGARTGKYVTGDDHPVGPEISSPDYAVAVLDELETPTHLGRRFTVAH